jgi:hypothetical protein
MMICTRCGGLASLAGEPLLCERCRATMPSLGALPSMPPPPRQAAALHGGGESAASTPWRDPSPFPFRGLGAALGLAVCTFLGIAGFSMFLRAAAMGRVRDFGLAVLFGAVAVAGSALAIGQLNDRRGATLAHAIVHTILGALFLLGMVVAFGDGEGGIAFAFALLVAGSSFGAGFTYTALASRGRSAHSR